MGAKTPIDNPVILATPLATHGLATRKWQGVPGIERTKGGRLYAAWYSGQENEGWGNYVVLASSDDDGFTWHEPLLAVTVTGEARAFDPCLWHDPLGRLWFFWAQNHSDSGGACGVWAMICEKPDADSPMWGKPRRLCNGVMMNKPIVASWGEWLLPVAIWAREGKLQSPELAAEQYSSVFSSRDNGESFTRVGGADVPNRDCDEHMIVERSDGSLWMLVRTAYGIGESISYDRGSTWSPGQPSTLSGPKSRFFIRRLHSGRLLLVNHYKFTGRSHLTALLSEDDGKTWIGGLLLDEREWVSYPDGIETDAGDIYVIYDRERVKEKEILMAVFTEEDVLAGRCVSAESRLRCVISKP